MKKVLLLLSALFTFGTVMAADPVVSITTVAANQAQKISSYTGEFQLQEPGSDFSWTVKNFNNNNSSWTNIRCGSKNGESSATITTDFAISASISTVEVEVGCWQTTTNNTPNSVLLLVSGNADMSEATTYSFNTSELPTAKNGVETVTVSIDAPAANMYYQLVFNMPKTSTNGIYSVNSIKYYGEGAVTAPERGEYASIAEFLAAKPSKDSDLNTTLTAIYKNGRNLYLTDGKDFILAYNANNIAALDGVSFSNGDKFASMAGNYKDQNGLPELIPSAIGEVTTGGAAVEPEVLAIEEIGSDMLNKFVKIEGVSIKAAATANNYTMTDETGSILLYNTFYNASYYDAVTVPEGDNFNVTGFISIYKEDLQFTPIAIEGGKVIETVATPVITPASGSELHVGDQITIECETEGAQIYFTTEDETPSASSQLYTGPLTYSEAVTIRAIAVKDGWYDSKVAEATYTTAVEGASTVSVDFTANGNIADIYTGTATLVAGGTDDTDNNLDGATFAVGAVNVEFAKAEGGNEPRWWETSTIKPELRTYTNNTITVKIAQDGYKLQSVKFVQGNASLSNFNKLTATVETNLGEATFASSTKSWTAEADELVNEVVFTIGATNRCGGLEITYVEDENGLAGIEEIAGDLNNANAPVEYFNLQGVRVNAENATPGIYIRRQGSETTKVLVK